MLWQTSSGGRPRGARHGGHGLFDDWSVVVEEASIGSRFTAANGWPRP
jgi:hypothetical protein